MAVSAWTAGERVTADRLNQMLPRWSSWTPTWSTSSGAATPSFGNATITGEYCQTGDLVVWRLEIVFGSTTNFGGGGAGDNWRFSTPVTALTTSQIAGTGELHDAATGGSPSTNRAPVRVRLTTTTTFELEPMGGYTGAAGGYAAAPIAVVDAITPWTWASSDAIRLSGEYEAA